MIPQAFNLIDVGWEMLSEDILSIHSHLCQPNTVINDPRERLELHHPGNAPTRLRKFAIHKNEGTWHTKGFSQFFLIHYSSTPKMTTRIVRSPRQTRALKDRKNG